MIETGTDNGRDIFIEFNMIICDVLSSTVTHTRNWCSAFNPSKCTHTAVSSEHTHCEHALGAVGSHCSSARGAIGGSVPCSNLYKWFRMQRHDWSSMSPKEPMLHLSSSHCTGYQWQLASSSRHWCLHTERPQAQHPPTSTHYYESTSPPEVWDLLVSDALWYHHREAQNHSPEHSHSPFLDGGIIFPPLSGMLDPCQSSSNNWKLISFGITWLHPKLVLKKKTKKNFPFIFLSFPC